MQLAWLVPRFIRDFLYDIIAQNRHKWFGKQESCLLPDPAFKARFIG
jgi:predicted DCC family thiol-disulfide oxidoreductase YuxK